MIEILAIRNPCQTVNEEANIAELVDTDAVSWAKRIFSRTLRRVQSILSLVIRFKIVLVKHVAWLANSLGNAGLGHLRHGL